MTVIPPLLVLIILYFIWDSVYELAKEFNKSKWFYSFFAVFVSLGIYWFSKIYGEILLQNFQINDEMLVPVFIGLNVAMILILVFIGWAIYKILLQKWSGKMENS